MDTVRLLNVAVPLLYGYCTVGVRLLYAYCTIIIKVTLRVLYGCCTIGVSLLGLLFFHAPEPLLSSGNRFWAIFFRYMFPRYTHKPMELVVTLCHHKILLICEWPELARYTQ